MRCSFLKILFFGLIGLFVTGFLLYKAEEDYIKDATREIDIMRDRHWPPGWTDRDETEFSRHLHAVCPLLPPPFDKLAFSCENGTECDLIKAKMRLRWKSRIDAHALLTSMMSVVDMDPLPREDGVPIRSNLQYIPTIDFPNLAKPAPWTAEDVVDNQTVCSSAGLVPPRFPRTAARDRYVGLDELVVDTQVRGTNTIMDTARRWRKQWRTLMSAVRAESMTPVILWNVDHGVRRLFVDLQAWEKELNTASEPNPTAKVFATIDPRRMRQASDSAPSKPVVLLATLNENWGMLSNAWPAARSVQWGTVTEATGLSHDRLEELLSDRRMVRALFVNQHQNFSDVVPNVISVPIGPHSVNMWWCADRTMPFLKNVSEGTTSWPRNNLLAITFRLSPSSPNRNVILEELMAHGFEDSFTIADTTTNSMTAVCNKHEDFFRHLSQSFFTVCPPGLGVDSRRLWETILAGSVPIIERGTGLDRTLSYLPALLVPRLERVTPAMLEAAKRVLWSLVDSFQHERMLASFWQGVMINASTDTTFRMETVFPMGAVRQRWTSNDTGLDYRFVKP